MKKSTFLPLALLSISFMFFSCQKKDSICDVDNAICSAYSQNDLEATGQIIDKFLSQQNQKDSDEEKINQFKRWLNCMECIEEVEIICVSCIETLPPQSELRIKFKIGQQEKTEILDVLMSDTLKFNGFHN